MRHGCTVTVSAIFIAGVFSAGLGLAPTASQAACDPASAAGCTADSQRKAAAPLQLKRFMKLGPARRSVSSRPDAQGAGRKQAAKQTAKQTPKQVQRTPPKVTGAAPTAADTAPLSPKAIPTLSIPVPALALTPAPEDRTVGFAATTEPWTAAGPFAQADQPEVLPAGVTIARAEEVNEIDLAADATNTAGRAVKSDSLASVSLITRANAGTPLESAAAKSEPETSWLSWVYGRLVDGILAVFLAIRSMLA
jgi:hypothetical protein